MSNKKGRILRLRIRTANSTQLASAVAVPDANILVLERRCRRVAADEPEQLFGHGSPENALRRQQRERVTKVESHHRAKNGESADAGAVICRRNKCVSTRGLRVSSSSYRVSNDIPIRPNSSCLGSRLDRGCSGSDPDTDILDGEAPGPRSDQERSCGGARSGRSGS